MEMVITKAQNSKGYNKVYAEKKLIKHILYIKKY